MSSVRLQCLSGIACMCDCMCWLQQQQQDVQEERDWVGHAWPIYNFPEPRLLRPALQIMGSSPGEQLPVNTEHPTAEEQHRQHPQPL